MGTFLGDVVFREGDRVLQQRNDYDKEVFNGDLGIIRQIDTKESTANGACGVVAELKKCAGNASFHHLQT